MVASCPRCRIDLFRGEAGGVIMLGCGRCGGVWLDNAAVQRMQQVAPDEAVSLADRASAHASEQTDRAAAAECPGCAKPMERVAIKAAAVEVDVCGAHGTWFDRDELHAVATAFSAIRQRRSGGGQKALYAGAAVAGAAGAAAIVASDPEFQTSTQSAAASMTHMAASAGSVAVDVVGSVGSVAADVATSAAGELILEGVGELAVGAVGLIFSLFD